MPVQHFLLQQDPLMITFTLVHHMRYVYPPAKCGSLHPSILRCSISHTNRTGSMHKTYQVSKNLIKWMLHKVPWPKKFGFNTLVTCSKQYHSLTFSAKMEDNQCLFIDGDTFITLLQSCAKLKDIKYGLKLHVQIAQAGFLERDRCIGGALIHMYAKCVLFTKALQVFNRLAVRDVVLWTSLISGYAEHGHGKEALQCFEKMQLEGLSPNDVTYICSIKAGKNIRSVDDCLNIYAEVERRELLCENPFLGSVVVDMYSKLGSLRKAQDVFDRLSIRNKVMWNILIVGYGAHGHAGKALTCFKQMQVEGFVPNSVTFLGTLKACSSIGAFYKGHEIHTMIESQGLLEKDLLVGSTLVDMYSKCGLLSRAQEVFDKLSVRNVVSWTALIAGYAETGHVMEVLHCFERMVSSGISPNAFTYVYILIACSSVGLIDKGREIHSEIARQGLILKDQNVGNALVDMYAKCGMLVMAHEVFNKLPGRTVVSWTALITGYAEHGHTEMALQLYDEMQYEGTVPNMVTLICILKACGNIKAVGKGSEIHAEIREQGLEMDVVVGNALVDMYAKCGMLALAQQVFDKLPERTVVSWTALVSGYAEYGQSETAIKYYKQMQREGISPDAIAYNWILKACSSVRDVESGEEVPGEIARMGLLEKDFRIGNALVDMYSKCGLLFTAQQVFDKLPVKDVWGSSALIAGYTENGLDEEALSCFEKIQVEGVSPNAVLYTLILRTCASVGALDKGNEIHAEVQRQGFLGKDLLVGNTLVDMYAKCGVLTKAQEMFDKLPERDVVSWTALMMGYTQHGENENTLYIFDRMLEEGVKPDPVIYIVVLMACSRTSLYNKSQTYVEAMQKHHGVVPTSKHHTCIVDLLSRAGELDKAVAMMNNFSDLVMWRAVLGACRKWGIVELGKQAFKHSTVVSEKEDLWHTRVSSYMHAGA